MDKREQIIGIINGIQCPNCCELLSPTNNGDVYVGVLQATAQILALFQPVSAEELKKIIIEHDVMGGCVLDNYPHQFSTVSVNDLASALSNLQLSAGKENNSKEKEVSVDKIFDFKVSIENGEKNVWLTYKNGMINLNALAEKRGGIIGNKLQEAIDEYLTNPCL